MGGTNGMWLHQWRVKSRPAFLSRFQSWRLVIELEDVMIPMAEDGTPGISSFREEVRV